MKFGKPETALIPQVVFTAYNFSHSLFTAGLILLVIRFVISKELFAAALAYPLHILLDIPTHDKTFFPTPFLFPVSDFRIDGISWGDTYFMISNYAALLTVYFFYFRAKARRKIAAEKEVTTSPTDAGGEFPLLQSDSLAASILLRGQRRPVVKRLPAHS